jgi:4-amino-4-deoxy-L-arabinose transferase-like glycosyltransferase
LQGSALAKRVWLFFFLAIIAAYFYGLGRPPLLGPDEPRYAQVAREMFLRGDLFTPTLGSHTWFEKPSLLYWMMMASYGLFGVSEFAARLGPAVSGLITVLTIFWMGRRVERATEDAKKPHGLGQWSSLTLATTVGMIVFSRGASFDIVVTMTLTIALACFFVSEIERDAKRRRWLLVGFYAAMGASLLAKGLVGIVIPFGVVGAYFLARRKWPDRKLLLSLCWGLPVTVAIAATWYGPVIARHGWLFIDEFFIQHHFARFVSNKYSHPQPFWFYLPITLFLAFPWTALVIASLVGIRRWGWRKNDVQSKFHVFTFAWMIVPVAFFSLSGSKLPGYVLPALPAVMLLVGSYIVRFLKGETSTVAVRLTGVLLVCLVLAGVIYGLRPPRIVSPACIAFVAAPFLIAGVFLLTSTHRRRLCVIVLICSTLISTVIGAYCVSEAIGERESVRGLFQRASARGYGNAPVYGLHTIEQTAEFYAAGRVARDSNGKAVRFEGPQQLLGVANQSGQPVLVIVPLEFESQLTSYRLLATEVIGDNGSVALAAIRRR